MVVLEFFFCFRMVYDDIWIGYTTRVDGRKWLWMVFKVFVNCFFWRGGGDFEVGKQQKQSNIITLNNY